MKRPATIIPVLLLLAASPALAGDTALPPPNWQVHAAIEAGDTEKMKARLHGLEELAFSGKDSELQAEIHTIAALSGPGRDRLLFEQKVLCMF